VDGVEIGRLRVTITFGTMKIVMKEKPSNKNGKKSYFMLRNR
jgi:hypothetical protein